MNVQDDLIIDLTSGTPPSETPQHCPICGISVSAAELAAHVNAHFASEDQLPPEHCDPPVPAEGVPISCPLCGQTLSPDEIDSHALAHAIELEDIDPQTVADDLYYEELRATYGFTAPHRATGRCFICGEAGHWVPECPKNPDNIASQARIIPEPTAETVAAAQLPDPQFQRPPFDPGAMLRMLGQCTAKQNLPHEFSRCTTLLCGTVAHFGGQRIDSGWGCGYRNIQMMATHLLATDDLAAETLFSGCRFVPDIPSLQAWIEVAWGAGFDSVGARQLEGKLQGSKKWIGTTEAAALFRYFGIPAIIIDFGSTSTKRDGLFNDRTGAGDTTGKVNRPQQMRISTFTTAKAPTETGLVTDSNQASAQAGEVHENVECDVCGSFPIQGERFKSQILPNYDVCSQCMHNNAEIKATAGPFSRIPVLTTERDEDDLRKQEKAPHKRTKETNEESTFDAETLDQDMSGGGEVEPTSPDAPRTTTVSVGGAARHSKPDGYYQDGKSQIGRKKECTPAGKSMLKWVWEYFSEGADSAATTAAAAEAAGLGGNGASSSTPTLAHPPKAHSHNHPSPPVLHLSRGGPGWKLETRYTCRCPLYLQHEGHSRTIIGVEKKTRRDGTSELTLLMLDPGVPPPALHDALAEGIKWQRLIKRSAPILNKSQYQILYCPNLAVPAKPGSSRYEALKVLAAQESH